MKKTAPNVYIIKSGARQLHFNAITDFYSDLTPGAIEEVPGIFPKEAELPFDYLKKFQKNYQRSPLIGEYGCLLSHTLIWKKITKGNNELAIILEDDAQIISNKNFEFLRDFFLTVDDPTIVRLGKSKITSHDYEKMSMLKAATILKAKNENTIVNEWFLNTDGTVAYAINLKAANILVNSMHVFDGRLVDDWQFTKKLGVNVYTLKPYPICECFEPSTISSLVDTRVSRDNFIKSTIKKIVVIASKAFNMVRGFGFRN
ncbi:MAG: glycosyltransferase family 25 protein [Fluviibacter sp.]